MTDAAQLPGCIPGDDLDVSGEGQTRGKLKFYDVYGGTIFAVEKDGGEVAFAGSCLLQGKCNLLAYSPGEKIFQGVVDPIESYRCWSIGQSCRR